MALWSVAYLGSRPLAASGSGAVTDLLGVEIALLAVSLLLLYGATLVRPSRTERTRPADA